MRQRDIGGRVFVVESARFLDGPAGMGVIGNRHRGFAVEGDGVDQCEQQAGVFCLSLRRSELPTCSVTTSALAGDSTSICSWDTSGTL